MIQSLVTEQSLNRHFTKTTAFCETTEPTPVCNDLKKNTRPVQWQCGSDKLRTTSDVPSVHFILGPKNYCNILGTFF